MDSRNSLAQAGLLMIAAGIIGLIFTFLLIPKILESFEYLDIAVQRPAFIIAFILGLFGSSFQLITGVIGVQSWQIDENANKCIKLGIMFLIIKFSIDIIKLLFLGNTISIFKIILGILSYIIPIFYIYGAIMAKRYEDFDYEDNDINQNNNDYNINIENKTETIPIQDTNKYINENNKIKSNDDAIKDTSNVKYQTDEVTQKITEIRRRLNNQQMATENNTTQKRK